MRIYNAATPRQGIRAPVPNSGGLGVARAIAPYDNKTKLEPTNSMSFEEYVNGLPKASGNTRRGGKRATPTATTATGKARVWDKPTTYDPIIERSAQEAGIDPVIFKRLLGTESAFDPNAVSYAGRGAGLGIAQINAVHGMPDEDRLNPAVAIPKGAQILAQYVKAAGGDYREALLRYKGAASAKGRAAMAGVVDDILTGLNPMPAANAGEPVGDISGVAEGGGSGTIQIPGVQTGAGSKSPSQFYLANPDAVSHDMRVVQQQRAELVQLAGMYQRSGMGQQYMEARAKVQEIDNNLVFLAGMQGIRELQEANDPRRLAKAWSYKEGIPIEFVPRTDNSFDVMVNGQRTAQGVPRDQIMDTALSMFDPAYRERKGKMSEAAYESQLKREEDTSSQTAQMIREIAVKKTDGNQALALEWAKQNWGWEIKGPAADGTYLIKPPGEAPRWFDPAGETIDIDGTEVVSRGAKPIAGLTTGAR
jgi:Transglycosylase SLT domain